MDCVVIKPLLYLQSQHPYRWCRLYLHLNQRHALSPRKVTNCACTLTDGATHPPPTPELLETHKPSVVVLSTDGREMSLPIIWGGLIKPIHTTFE